MQDSRTYAQHNAGNAMVDPGEIARFYDRCSDLMRELLTGLAAKPERPRPFPEVEDEIGWPRRRIASVLGAPTRSRSSFAGQRAGLGNAPRHPTLTAMFPPIRKARPPNIRFSVTPASAEISSRIRLAGSSS